ncbi:SufE family protein [Parashewanella spongiae]|uniref:SufE family protein n=1 Tax=Parashewanella spongiae TaxID=342950 RepID=A0A3A6TJ73_9GAMM|nr:SufE family protein [Parashewanella spongiae]MCL1078854.1 SufE family protein [Parashewanella spongiae]RJY11830.1 SufE family protein [Parashewanella spongiae]
MSSFIPANERFLYEVESIENLKHKFAVTNNWQEKYRLLMLLGKSVPSISDEYKVEPQQVDGCESAAWLYHYQQDDKHYFLADSDARIVKGLISILLIMFHSQDSKTICGSPIEATFEQLGLLNQLSPSRANGLQALAAKMVSYAKS